MSVHAQEKVTIGLIQMRAHVSPEENRGRALRLVEEACRRGAKIVCLQELFTLPYFCREENTARFRLAETVPGPTTEIFSEAARKNEAVIIVPVFEKRGDGVYHNSAAIFDADGKMAGLYRKMHLPDDPAYYEKFYFSPGDLGFNVIRTRYAALGVLICWDQWFPEAARICALKGAQILFYPTAIGWHEGESGAESARYREAWETVQRSHAVTNGVYVAAVNRTGKEGVLSFWGGSFVADPSGAVTARASEDREEVLLAECDLSEIAQCRHNWPFFRDRRIDAYQELNSRYLDC